MTNDAAARPAPSWRPLTLIERVGAALVAPVRALRAADDPEAAGRASSDAALLMLVSVLAIYAVDVVRAVWLALADSVSAGVSSVLSIAGRAVGTDLVLLLVAGGLVTLAAGARRSIGRDFDLACVAYVPFVTTKLGAKLAIAGAALPATPAVTQTVGAIGLGWAAVLVVLAIREARRR